MTMRQAELLLAAVISARATSFMFSKVLVESLQPFDILAVRFLLATALLVVVFHRQLQGLSRSTIAHGSIIGLAFFATMACEMYALEGASSSTVSFLENMAVAFVPLATALMARRLPRPSMALACIVAIIGVGLLTLGSTPGADSPSGILFGLGAGLGYTVAIIATAKLSKNDDALQLGIIQIAVMGLCSLVATLVLEKPALPSTPAQWASIAVLIIVCTGFGFTLQPMAQKHLSADTAGLFCALSPLVATVFGCAFLGEGLTLERVFGMALIISAMLIASISWDTIRMRITGRSVRKRTVDGICQTQEQES
jgi:drug/metabolite transporter (DMT)-like permease